MINGHVESILNAGTVLVLNLTLGALLSYEVLVLTRMMARRSGDSPIRWSMNLFKWLWFNSSEQVINAMRGDGNPTTFARME